MCTYKRPERLAITLEQLEAQEGVKVKLYIWNNNPEISGQVDEIVSRSQLEVQVHHNPDNVGGFGRFYKASEIAEDFPFIVTIDDDVNFGPHAIKTLVNEFKPNTIHSFFAFKLINAHDYFDRTVSHPGETADYCGTGGEIIDSSIFKNQRLFECPEKYWFLEDLWLCFVAKQNGWELYKSAADLHLDEGDFKDQWLQLKPLKTEFLEYLVNQGFKITANIQA